MAKKTIALPDGTQIPRIGQGTWYLGEKRSHRAAELEALRAGMESGLTLIDSAEMYGEGRAEELVGEAIRGVERGRLFLVSKVYPHNAGRENIFKSCDASLRRMGVETMDLYLLHWRGRIPLSETAECMEELVKRGKIKRWGVSNFDTSDMEELWGVRDGERCAVNQVLYHLGSRGVEYSLLPWMRERDVPLMAYCPLAQAGKLRKGLMNSPAVLEAARAHGASPAQVLLAFVLRGDGVFAIPRTGSAAHARENAAALSLELAPAELEALDRAFPAPTGKTYLDIV